MSVKTIVVCDYCNAEIINTNSAFSVIGGQSSFSLIEFEAGNQHVHEYCAELELKSWLHKRDEERIKATNDMQN